MISGRSASEKPNELVERVLQIGEDWMAAEVACEAAAEEVFAKHGGTVHHDDLVSALAEQTGLEPNCITRVLSRGYI